MNLTDNPNFKRLNPMKQRIISEIINQSGNKPMEQLLTEVMQINQELNRRNMSFTKQESDVLMTAIGESLNPNDKKKFDMIKSLMMGSNM